MKKYYCTVCQWVYDPTIGDPEQGIEPGVAFENLPEDWVCPLCGTGSVASGANTRRKIRAGKVSSDTFSVFCFTRSCFFPTGFTAKALRPAARIR